MPGKETLSKSRKFLFDQNCFDDDYVEEPEFVEPPPPVFSEEELETARKDSYAQGKKDGLEEARVSREKFVSELIQKIQREFKTLFAAESERAALFETESVYLARAVFSRLFPLLNEKNGLAEVEAVIVNALENGRNIPEIIVEVNPDYVESVQQHIAKTAESLSAAGTCRIAANPALKAGDCHLVWQDGGAERSADAIADQIAQIFEQTLADRARLPDNGKESTIDTNTDTDTEKASSGDDI